MDLRSYEMEDYVCRSLAALLHKSLANVRRLHRSLTLYLQNTAFLSGRCWDRTSDLCRVNANPPVH